MQMKKLKIACFFSGRCNGYEQCLSKLYDKFYSRYDIDFFWSIDEIEETPYYAQLKTLLNPKGIFYQKVDKKIIDVPLSSQETRQRNTLSMFFHNFHCLKMIKQYIENTNVTYHAIVRFRAEIDSDDFFTIPEQLLENTIYIPYGYNYRGVSDRIAYGTLISMEKYCELYTMIPNYVFARHAIFNPEYLLMFHINENNMNLIRFPYTYKLHPSRHKVKYESNDEDQMSSTIITCDD